MPSDILIIPNRNSTSIAPAIHFSGSQGNNIRLEVLTSGSLAFLGRSGSLFSINDNLSGSLMAVGDISGLPIFEVFSDDRVVMGRFNSNTLVVTGSSVGIGKSNPNPATRLDVSGSVFVTGSLATTSAITSGGTVSILGGNTLRLYNLANSEYASVLLNPSNRVSINYPIDLNGSLIITGSITGSSGLGLFAGGSNTNITFTPSGFGYVKVIQSTSTTATDNYALTVGIGATSDVVTLGNHTNYAWLQSFNSRPLSINPLGNAVLVGTTTNSSNGVIQLAAATGTAGGIAFGETTIYRNFANQLSTNAGSITGGVGVGYFSLVASGSNPLVFNNSAGESFRVTPSRGINVGATTDVSAGNLNVSASIHAGGRIGINALTTAQSQLEVRAATDDRFGGIFLTDTTNQSAAIYKLSTGVAPLILRNNAFDAVSISAGLTTISTSGNVNQLIVSSSGYVGVGGVSSVASRLHVYESTSGVGDANGLTIEQAGTSDSVIQFLLTATQRWSMGIDNSDSDKFKIGTGTLGSADRVVIHPSGNVGIGNSNPLSLLHITGSTPGDGGSFSGSGSLVQIKQNSGWSANQPWALFVEGYSYLNGFRINAADGLRALYKTAAGGQLGFAVSGNDPITFTQNDNTERMRVAAGGNVGIGTTTPNAKLDVNGNTIITGSLTVTGGVRTQGAGSDILHPFLFISFF